VAERDNKPCLRVKFLSVVRLCPQQQFWPQATARCICLRAAIEPEIVTRPPRHIEAVRGPRRSTPKQATWGRTQGIISLCVINLVPFSACERMGRIGSLRLRHDVWPQSPVRPIVEVEELRGAAVIEPDFIAAAVLNGFVLSEVYIGHAPMMPCGAG
jgi:hypothetical protein